MTSQKREFCDRCFSHATETHLCVTNSSFLREMATQAGLPANSKGQITYETAEQTAVIDKQSQICYKAQKHVDDTE